MCFALVPARRRIPTQSTAVDATFASSSGFCPAAKAARSRSRWWIARLATAPWSSTCQYANKAGSSGTLLQVSNNNQPPNDEMKSAPTRGMPYQPLKTFRTGHRTFKYFAFSSLDITWWTTCGIMI